MFLEGQCSSNEGKQVTSGSPPIQTVFSDALYGQQYNFSVAAYVMDGAAELPSSGRAEATLRMCKCV